MMRLQTQAYQAREAARRAIGTGDFGEAQELSETAQWLAATPRGRRLQMLSEWLAAP